MEKHSLSNSFIITLEQSYDVFPNSGLSKLLDLVVNFGLKLFFELQFTFVVYSHGLDINYLMEIGGKFAEYVGEFLQEK